MEISLNTKGGFELIIEAENVKIVEDIEERVYVKGEDNKIIRVERDIKEQPIMTIINVLDEIMYRRVKEIDSSTLIQTLFTKLPSNVASDLVEALYGEYKL